MWKLAVFSCVVALALGVPSWAGELDREPGKASLPASGALAITVPAPPVSAASELDRETPRPACWGYGLWGFGPCYGGMCPPFFGGSFSVYAPPIGLYAPGFVGWRGASFGWGGGFPGVFPGFAFRGLW
jgi:hypothetical protein